jgi:hypothetical protein
VAQNTLVNIRLGTSRFARGFYYLNYAQIEAELVAEPAS